LWADVDVPELGGSVRQPANWFRLAET